MRFHALITITILLLTFTRLNTLMATPIEAHETDLAEQWSRRSAALRLDQSPEWRKILLYTPHWLGGMTSLADQREFFLADDGGSRPDHEMTATIKAFFGTWTGDPNLHPVCRYPRRLKYIERALGETLPDRFRPACDAYHHWRQEHPVHGLSLVFASNYLNNPASLYGHTFIRLHRDRGDGSGTSPLLDYAVNFAANPTTTNPILYPLFGMTGRFFGTFSLMPYYVKVQEYNNAESRDLFEYPLLLTAREVDNFMDILWEAGPYGIRYWYMDENCSYVLLAMLEAAKPEINATETFLGVVSPKDTLLVLKPYNILAPPVRRPATMTRFNVRRAELSDAERETLSAQVRQKSLLHEIKAAPPDSRARVLDAVLEWISWDEKLAGSHVAKKHEALWTETLKARAELGTPSTPLDLGKNPVTPPEDGHRSHRSYLSPRIIQGRAPEMMFGLRLTLHDFVSPPAGYSPEQETTMGDFQGVLRKNASDKTILEWERFTWVRIVSTPAFDPMLPSPSWTLTAQTQRMWGYGRDSWLAHRLESGAGIAWANQARKLRAWMIPVLSLGHLLPDDPRIVHYGVGVRSGLALDPGPEWRAIMGADLDRYYGERASSQLRDVYLTASWMRQQSHEYRLSLRARAMNRHTLTRSAELTWMRYF